MTTSPVLPVSAASVILMRPGPAGECDWQCFMVRRHVRSEFAADVFVFPGGKVDAADSGVRFRSSDALPAGITDMQTWNAFRGAAIRELFEEAGILLACAEDGSTVNLTGARSDDYAAYRKRLQTGELTLSRLLDIESLTPAAETLHPLSRWITPEPLPRRYDTWFFGAELPNGQEPLHDAIETTESTWIAPQAALDAYLRDEFPLVFATEMHLKRMARYGTIRDLIAGVTPADLQPVMPRIVRKGGETIFLLPGDDGFD